MNQGVLEWLAIFAAIICSIAAYVSKRRIDKRDSDPENARQDGKKEQEFLQSLPEEENLLAVCPTDIKSQYYCAVTDRGIYIETKNGLVTIPRETVRKVIYYDHSGHKTRPDKEVFYVMIKADKKYKIFQYSNRFSDVVAALANSY